MSAGGDTTDATRALTAKICRYAELFDTGQFDAFAAQFEPRRVAQAAPAAEGVRPHLDEHGHTYDGSRRTKHVTTNPRGRGGRRGRHHDRVLVLHGVQASSDFTPQAVFRGVTTIASSGWTATGDGWSGEC